VTSKPGQPATRQPGGIPTVVSNLDSQVDLTTLVRSLAAEPTVEEAMRRLTE
jgi:hypothetical protein